jgi:DNA-binding transcriptional LysR family regulator
MAIADPKMIRQCVMIAELGALGAAAAALNMPQPWLSTRLRRYEQEIGFAIFDRSHRELRLTHKGEQYIALAKTLLSDMDRFGSAISRIAEPQVRAELIVGCPAAGSGAPERNALIESFKRTNPNIIVRIRLLAADQIIDGLTSGKLGVSFALTPLACGAGSFERIPIRLQRALILMPSDWRNSQEDTIALSDLHGRDLAVMPRSIHPELCEPIFNDLEEHGVRLVEVADDNFMTLHSYAVDNNMAALTVEGFKDHLSKISGYCTIKMRDRSFESELILVRSPNKIDELYEKLWLFSKSYIKNIY